MWEKEREKMKEKKNEIRKQTILIFIRLHSCISYKITISHKNLLLPNDYGSERLTSECYDEILMNGDWKLVI
jgi:hypothetical protein